MDQGSCGISVRYSGGSLLNHSRSDGEALNSSSPDHDSRTLPLPRSMATTDDVDVIDVQASLNWQVTRTVRGINKIQDQGNVPVCSHI